MSTQEGEPWHTIPVVSCQRKKGNRGSQKKPVIPLLHKNPDNLPRDKTETATESWESSRSSVNGSKISTRAHTGRPRNDLKAKVIVGLTTTIKRHPAIGWVRADRVPAESTVAEILKLRNHIAELEQNAEADKTHPPEGAEDLMQGDDEFEIHFEFSVWSDDLDSQSYNARLQFTWNDVFAGVAPRMINECSAPELQTAFGAFF